MATRNGVVSHSIPINGTQKNGTLKDTVTPIGDVKPISLAIVGGGLGGLCLAVSLHGRNVPVHVYEAAPSFGEIGAGVGLGPNALRAMAMLDSEQKILRGYKRCETSNVSLEEQKRFFNFRYGMAEPLVCKSRQQKEGEDCVWTGGRLIADLRSEEVTSSVHRARLLSQLVELMPEDRASFGKRLVSIDEIEDGGANGNGGVVLRFDDGTEARHDAVIGCDGIKSQTRRILLGKGHEASEPVFSGKFCYRGLVPAEKAKEVLGEDLAVNSQMYLGKGGHVITTLIEQGKTVNVVAYHATDDGQWHDEAWVIPTTREEMRSKYDGWFEPVMHVLDLVENPIAWALFDHLPAPTFHRKGRICLLGDSAHASTPHHGAGAGMAVEDAMVMSHLLAAITDGSELEKVFTAYDAVRRPRAQRLVASSRKIAEVYDFEDAKTSDDMAAMAEHLLHAWDWIWKEDMNAQLDAALKTFAALRDAK